MMNDVNFGANVARGRGAAMSVERVRLSQQIEQLARSSDESFAAGYTELVSCLERQMRSDEALMESVNSRALRSHQEQHARVLAALHQAEPLIEEGEVTLGREALALLDQWLPAQRATLEMALLTSLTPMGRRRPLESRKLDARNRRSRHRSQPGSSPFATA
jgi:hemerythrin